MKYFILMLILNSSLAFSYDHKIEGCGEDWCEPKLVVDNVDIKRFVDEFKKDLLKEGLSFEARRAGAIKFKMATLEYMKAWDEKFGNNDGVYPVASCRGYEGEVIILDSDWNQSDDFSKRELIYHELGHCVLDLSHVKGEDIMKSKGMVSNKDNWDKLVKKMIRRYKRLNYFL